MRNERGFSLIELLIVVAVILILAAIVIPNWERSRLAANEASAVATVRVITSAQSAYTSAYQIGYADDLTKLGPPPAGTPASATNADLIDWVIGCTSQPCPKSGYGFSITATGSAPFSTYNLNGKPLNPGQTGKRGFCSDQSAVILFDPSGGTSCTAALQ